MSTKKPGDVVVERRHRRTAIEAYWGTSDYRGIHCGADYVEHDDPRAIDGAIRRFALALATIEHNARREAFIDVAAWLDSSGLPGYINWKKSR